MDVAVVLGLWCTALSISFIWPQVLRVYRQQTVEGLSPAGTLHGASGSVLWCLYGIARGDLPLSVANAMVLLAMALIAAAQVRHRVLATRIVTLVAFSAIALALACLAVSPALLGWVAIIVGATSILPQTWHTVRTPDLSALSVPTYAMLVLTAVSWSLYGMVIGDPLVVMPNLLVIPCSIVIATKALAYQRRHGATTGGYQLNPELAAVIAD